MRSTGRPLEILEKLNEMAGFDADEEIELFEVCFSSESPLSPFGSLLLLHCQRVLEKLHNVDYLYKWKMLLNFSPKNRIASTSPMVLDLYRSLSLLYLLLISS